MTQREKAENPVLPEEDPSRPAFDTGVDPERPAELEGQTEKLLAQNKAADDGGQKPRPYAMPGEDEGPLGEGGQLRGPDAGGGGGQG